MRKIRSGITERFPFNQELKILIKIYVKREIIFNSAGTNGEGRLRRCLHSSRFLSTHALVSKMLVKIQPDPEIPFFPSNSRKKFLDLRARIRSLNQYF
jgi:hypothetical protein